MFPMSSGDEGSAAGAGVAPMVKRGRPKSAKRRVVRHVKLDEAIDDAVIRVAVRSGQTVNAVIRRALSDMLAKVPNLSR